MKTRISFFAHFYSLKKKKKKTILAVQDLLNTPLKQRSAALIKFLLIILWNSEIQIPQTLQQLQHRRLHQHHLNRLEHRSTAISIVLCRAK